MPRQRPRRDDCEADIILALKAAGWSVQQIDSKDVPDLILGKFGLNLLMEVLGTAKLKKNRERGGLTEGQQKWHREWRGSVLTARTVPEALEKAEGALHRAGIL